jgi:LysM repeat protein
MKWKDSGDMSEKEEKPTETFFDEEQYSPWSSRNSGDAGGRFKKIPIVLILLVLAIITSVTALLTMLLGNRGGETLSRQELALLQDSLRQVEMRLDKYESIDEKVTRIWEQAQTYEKFKERYDRGEASMTLRMDHLTMGLEGVLKQIEELRKSRPTVVAEAKPSVPPPVDAVGTVRYHTVAAGDTLFSIGQRYEIKVEHLCSLNRLSADTILQPGQRLIVSPAKKE